jgi:hypothetical protein
MPVTPVQQTKLRRKITLRLSPALHATTQEAVRLGLAPNQNAFIEDSIRLRSREIRHARMRMMAEEAMNDPGFVADMRDTMDAFKHVDSEGWPPELPFAASDKRDSR